MTLLVFPARSAPARGIPADITSPLTDVPGNHLQLGVVGRDAGPEQQRDRIFGITSQRGESGQFTHRRVIVGVQFQRQVVLCLGVGELVQQINASSHQPVQARLTAPRYL